MWIPNPAPPYALLPKELSSSVRASCNFPAVWARVLASTFCKTISVFCLFSFCVCVCSFFEVVTDNKWLAMNEQERTTCRALTPDSRMENGSFAARSSSSNFVLFTQSQCPRRILAFSSVILCGAYPASCTPSASSCCFTSGSDGLDLASPSWYSTTVPSFWGCSMLEAPGRKKEFICFKSQTTLLRQTSRHVHAMPENYKKRWWMVKLSSKRLTQVHFVPVTSSVQYVLLFSSFFQLALLLREEDKNISHKQRHQLPPRIASRNWQSLVGLGPCLKGRGCPPPLTIKAYNDSQKHHWFSNCQEMQRFGLQVDRKFFQFSMAFLSCTIHRCFSERTKTKRWQT